MAWQGTAKQGKANQVKTRGFSRSAGVINVCGLRRSFNGILTILSLHTNQIILTLRKKRFLSLFSFLSRT